MVVEFIGRTTGNTKTDLNRGKLQISVEMNDRHENAL